jgi:4-amino-4-deoxy-L-arabinose transferase-like glycosyltransferase
MNIDGTPNIETVRVASAPRHTTRAWASWSPALIALLLGIAALLPRALGLADFLTTDEAYHWIARTERFADAVADRRWAATLQTGHPGVTLMWLGSLGLALERPIGPGWIGAPALVAHLAWLRLPGTLLQALLVPAGYLLLRRLLNPTTALVAALLWASAPYLIAHARLLHLDALLTSFVTFSVLLLLVALETMNEERGTRNELPAIHRSSFIVHRSSRWLVASGIFAGLALLTKGPALILLPFAGLLLFALAPTNDQRPTTNDEETTTRHSSLVTRHATNFSTLNSQFSIPQRLRIAVPRYLLWLAVAALVVVLLWPALWTDPARALRAYVDEIASNGGRPNGDGQFFLGNAVGDPGPLFYPLADLFRMTPLTLLGLLAYFGFTIYDLRLRRHPAIANRESQIVNQRVLLALLAFVLFWTLVMTLGPKKFDRYVLPTWPALEILAAAGLSRILDFIFQILDFRSHRSKINNLKSKIVLALVTVGLAVNLIWYHPYYLSYYNPLLGGGVGAQRALLIGWGEGMDQVGAWLSAQPDINSGPVLSALGPTLQPFVPAPVRDVSDFGAVPANYAVVYLESVQRAADPALYDTLRQTIPLHKVAIHGIDYAQIYQLPRPFERPIDARWGAALHLRGITTTRAPGQIVVTPAWDVRAAPEADYQVFLHLLDAHGQRVGQIDVAPGGADFPPTSAWQPGRQIAVPLPLPLRADLPAGEYRLVMGLYDGANGQRPPLTEGHAADEQLDGPSVVLLDTISIP